MKTHWSIHDKKEDSRKKVDSRKKKVDLSKQLKLRLQLTLTIVTIDNTQLTIHN